MHIASRDGKFWCLPGDAPFSSHTGVCELIGDRRHRSVPRALVPGDLLRLGSVGLVVSEVRHSATRGERLSAEELQRLRWALGKDNEAESSCEAGGGSGGDGSGAAWEQAQVQAQAQTENTRMAALESAPPMIVAGAAGAAGCADGAGSAKEDDEEEEHRAGCAEADGPVAAFPSSSSGMQRIAAVRRASAAAVAAGLPPSVCYICYEGHCTANPLIAPCRCRGDTKYVHLACLRRWSLNGNEDALFLRTCNLEGVSSCSVCKSPYAATTCTLDGRSVSLLARLPPPSISLVVITHHKQDPRLTHLHYQLSFASLMPQRQRQQQQRRRRRQLQQQQQQQQLSGGQQQQQCEKEQKAEEQDVEEASALRSITIGRSSSQCDVPIKYRTVSSCHAALRYHRGQFLLEDLGSANGTVLFLRAPVELRFGDVALRVKLGRTVVTLRAKRERRLLRVLRALLRCRLLPPLCQQQRRRLRQLQPQPQPQTQPQLQPQPQQTPQPQQVRQQARQRRRRRQQQQEEQQESAAFGVAGRWGADAVTSTAVAPARSALAADEATT